MVENFVDFPGYIHLYNLERVEGVLLRHVASVHKVLAQTVPPAYKNADVQEIEDWLAGLLRGTDSSLLDEWEKLRDPNWKPLEEPETPKALEVIDITKNKREFTALIRTHIFHFLRPLAMGNYAAAAETVPPWTPEALGELLADYYAGHERIGLDPEARNSRHTVVSPSTEELVWTIHQTLIDPEGLNDWQATFTVSLDLAREEGRPTLVLRGIGPIVTAN
jgi:hypothetical protein